jgi:hypothetical protein
MTPEDLEKILNACKPVPMIMLQCGAPRSPQERANDAWAELGARMGFDHRTVKPTGEGDRFFTAVPSETEQHRAERLQREKEEAYLAEVERIEAEIRTLQDKLATMAVLHASQQSQETTTYDRTDEAK